MIDTIDIIKSVEWIVDAHERADGYIEAVFCNNVADEQLRMYEPILNKHNEPVFRSGKIPNPEMYRFCKKTKTWFHSKKTLNLYKKNKKEACEPVLQTEN
jgi:hypothetical protein